MKTVYDWVCLGIFAGLVVLFLQRSTAGSEKQDDPLVIYLIAGAMFGVANYLGNNGQAFLAVLLIIGAVTVIVRYLKPFQPNSKP